MPCVNLLVFSAGCSQDAETNYQLSLTNRIKNEVLISSSTNVQTRIQNYQSIVVVNYGTFQCEDLNIGNYISSDAKVYNDVSDEQSAEIIQIFKEQVATDVQTLASQDADTFTAIFGKQPDGESISNVTLDLQNNFESLVSVSSVKSALNEMYNTQAIAIYNYGRMGGTNCTINNEIIQTIAVQNVIKAVQTGLLQSETWVDVQTSIETTAMATSGSNISFMYSFLSVGIVVAGIILVAVIRAISGGRRKAAAAAAAAPPPQQAPYPYPPPYPPYAPPPPPPYAQMYPYGPPPPAAMPPTASQVVAADQAVRG